MKRGTRTRRLLLAAVVLLGCGDQPPEGTSDVTRALLAQPRPGDVSTAIDASRLGPDQPTLGIELLGVNLGSGDAPVKVIEFVDFGCGYCRLFQLETFPVIRAEFIETGKVEWKFMPFVTGMFDNSAVVTEAAECALEQDARLFGLLADRLWVEQSAWKRSEDPASLVRGWFAELRGDVTEFDTCVQEDTRMERVASATALAAQLEVRATPTFWIVGAGPIQGALPVEAFREIFNQAYRELTQPAG
jgi:protein-disulfide isomerase